MSGILIGLFSAFLQSCSYLASGRYVRELSRPAYTLLPPSFMLMGIAAVPIFFLSRPEVLPPLLPAIAAGAFCILFCFLGNTGMFFLLRTVDSSRASPLLALKVPMMALWFSLALGEQYRLHQWLGVGLVILSAFLLSGAGRPIPLRAWFWLFVACFGYCASDYWIQLTFEACRSSFAPGATFHLSIFSCALIYMIGGVISLLFYPFTGRFTPQQWKRYALPYAVCWLGSMIPLFACFALCGLVLGNIVQSTRGLISVVIGYLLARGGFSLLEEKVPLQTQLRRVAAAILIILAMALFRL